ncbi:MAG: isoprenylcysteine carboxylmethyltransferase family protein [Eubacteriales bacterium]|nr:isoprenylcysteine carboxylmethyltransferase family protein [Eubacteriales bacterium]
MKKKEHLPMYGVGPLYVAVIIGLTVLGIVFSKANIIPDIRFSAVSVILRILGIFLIVCGVYLWYAAVVKEKIDDGIVENKLVTTGVYGWVRNPIYSAFIFFCTGALLICGNICLLVLPFVYWGFLTVLMKHTEEKWLTELYGDEYTEYCKRVNRCIPWKRKECNFNGR